MKTSMLIFPTEETNISKGIAKFLNFDFQQFSYINSLSSMCMDQSFPLYQASSSPLFFPLFFFLEVLLGLFVSKGERGAKLIFFSASVLTMYEDEVTKLLPTLIWRCLIMALA